MKRKCRSCGVVKGRRAYPPSFWKRGSRLCSVCHNGNARKALEELKKDRSAYAAAKAAWKARNEQRRNSSADYYLRKKYGIGLADYERMLAEQGGTCKICGCKPGTRRFSVDHNHRTGAVRGLLCQQCNLLLGAAQDVRAIFESAIRYIEADGDVTPPENDNRHA